MAKSKGKAKGKATVQSSLAIPAYPHLKKPLDHLGKHRGSAQPIIARDIVSGHMAAIIKVLCDVRFNARLREARVRLKDACARQHQ